ncbi:MAG TPA: alpha/beta hydrolase [Myxococcaceae bacterium]|nr:alpha/beta hydrolase [Myxococcaceae bacterium]
MPDELIAVSSLVETTSFDLQLPSGSVRAYRLGSPGAPAVVCVPGLDANARSFDLVGAALARRGRQVITLDLRGRGASPATAPGTYGWVKHAKDVLAVATQLGIDTFDLAGHSMGALVSMQAAVLAPERVRRLVAIDTAGPMQLLAMPSVAAGSLRLLPFVYPSPGAYFAGMHAMGIVEPWEDLWKRAFAYELEGFLGLVRPRTSFRAVAEDFVYNLVHTGTSLWARLRLPTILVRGTRRLPPFGLVVGAKVRDAFLRSAPSAELAEVDANHFEILAHPGALRAIDEFLARPTGALRDSPGRPQTADERRAVPVQT